MKKTKVAIIGAGMAGVTAAIYLKRANCDFILLEANEVGGKLNELNEIENYPALGKTSGKDIASSLAKQLRELDIEVTKGNVQTILKNKEGFEITLDTLKIVANKVILATGGAKTKPEIKGEEEYFGSGVSYCAVCDGSFFKGLDVAVIGNGDDIIEEAIYLSGLVNKLYFVCPTKLKASKDAINALTTLAGIEVIENATVTEITGDIMGVNGIIVNGNMISVSGVFPFVGKKSTSQILSNLKPEMNGNFVKTDENMETNIKGLFAIGDLRDKKLRQLVTASSDGAIAAIKASNN